MHPERVEHLRGRGFDALPRAGDVLVGLAPHVGVGFARFELSEELFEPDLHRSDPEDAFDFARVHARRRHPVLRAADLQQPSAANGRDLLQEPRGAFPGIGVVRLSDPMFSVAKRPPDIRDRGERVFRYDAPDGALDLVSEERFVREPDPQQAFRNRRGDAENALLDRSGHRDEQGNGPRERARLPIRVVVRQDGSGRTHALRLAVEVFEDAPDGADVLPEDVRIRIVDRRREQKRLYDGFLHGGINLPASA